MSSENGRESWYALARRYLGFAFPPALVLAVIVSAAIAVPMLGLNPGVDQPREAALLMLYSLGFHTALIGGVVLVTIGLLALTARRSGVGFSRAVVTIQALTMSAAVLLALNAMLRFTLSYTLYRIPSGAVSIAFITPLGALNNVVFLAGVPVLFIALLLLMGGEETNGTKGVRRRRGALLLGGYLVLLAATVAANLADEQPRVADVAAVSGGQPAKSTPAWPQERAPSRVLVLGIDGLSWHVLGALLEQGALPHIAALVERGARANLQSDIPTLSPILWTSIGTGRHRDAHGVSGFTRFRLPGMKAFLERAPHTSSMNWWNGTNRFLGLAADLGLAEQSPFFSYHRRVAAVWDVAHQHGVSAGVISWYTTWPVQDLGPGSYMVSDFSGREGAFSPPDEIQRVFAETEIPPAVIPEGSPHRRHPALVRRWQRMQSEALKSIALYRHFAPRLALHAATSVDASHHQGWKGDSVFVIPSDRSYREFPRHVTDIYDFMDGIVGEHLGAIDAETLVLIISDHGYSFRGHEHQHAPPGVLLAAGPGVEAGKVLGQASIYDVVPTILAALGLPVSEEFEGRVLEELFRPGVLPVARRVAGYPWYEPPSSEVRRSLDVEREELERLKELGYVN